MPNYIFKYYTLILFLSPTCIYSQIKDTTDYYSLSKTNKKDSVAYTRDYKFTEGLYLSSKDFLQNNPITKERIIIDYPASSTDFWDQVMLLKSIKYINSKGDSVKILKSKVWGCSSKNIVYVSTTEGFSRMSIIGSICYIAAKHQNPKANLLENSNPNPVLSIENSNPNAVPNPHLPGDRILNRKYAGEGYFFWDAHERKSIDVDSDAIKLFLKNRDQSLYNEFIALPKKEQKYSTLIFVKKYNEKHPIYLPVK